ncbi:MAG: hypothetical protein AAB527_02020, partial [Patescibacteria group bacterium]
MARKFIPKILRNGKEYLSLTYAASFCGYNKERLRQLIQENKLAAERVKGVWFIEQRVLQNFIDEKRRNSQSVYRFFEEPKSFNNTQNKSFNDVQDKLDPWDVLLLGDITPKKHSRIFNPLSVLKLLLPYSPVILKSITILLIFATAGFFVFKSASWQTDSAFAKYNDFRNYSKKLVEESLDSIKYRASDIQNDLAVVVDYASLVLDGSFENISSAISNFEFLDIKISWFKIPEFKTPNLNFAQISSISNDALFGVFQNVLELQPLELGKKIGEKAGSSLQMPAFEFKVPNLADYEDIPLKFGKYTGHLFSKGVEKSRKRMVNLYNSSLERLTRLPETPQDIRGRTSIGGLTSDEESRSVGVQTLRSQGLEPSAPTSPVIAEKVIVERVVERLMSGLSKEQLDLALTGVNARILAEVSELKKLIQQKSNDNFAAIALTNRINTLTDVILTNPTIAGTISNLDDSNIPNDITVNTTKNLSGTSASFSSTFGVSGVSTLATTTITSLTITGAFTASSSGLSLDSTGTTTVAGYLDVAKGAEFGINKSVIFHENAPASSIVLDSAGKLTLNFAPTLPHIFSSWATNAASSYATSSSFIINPSSATADSNLIGVLVNDSVKFMIDAEGDIFAKSLTTEGSNNISSTTASTFLVENNATFGDAITDKVIFRAGTLQFDNRATSTIPNLTVNAWSIATSTSIVPTFTISTASSPFGFVGIGTTSPATTFSVAGAGYLTGNFTADGIFRSNSASASTFPYASSTALTVSGTGYFGTASTTNLTVSVLNSGRVPYITTAGAFTDDADLTFNGSILTATNASTTALTVSGTASTTNQVFSAMTSGSVLFAGAGGLLSQDNSNLFWDDTNNRLGIGTTTPRGTLGINDFAGVDPFVVGSTTAKFIIKENGQVGIGITNPLSGRILHLKAADTLETAIIRDSYSANSGNSNNMVRRAEGTFASPTAILTGTIVERYEIQGYDGASFKSFGEIRFNAAGTIGSDRVPGKIIVYTAEDAAGSAMRDRLNFGTTETVFNEDSIDSDFRIEGNGDANLFFVDAGNDRVG